MSLSISYHDNIHVHTMLDRYIKIQTTSMKKVKHDITTFRGDNLSCFNVILIVIQIWKGLYDIEVHLISI